jgi:UDP-N-acetylmuramyl pentapeptide synthase
LRLRVALAVAELQRRRLTDVTFIGVTGSCGKTTTKELIAHVLRSEFRGRSSPANKNSLTAVAKTVLRTNHRDAFCVIEVAASMPGFVPTAARVVRPQIAVVTNIGSDHRKAFRTLEATAAEKRELIAAVSAGGIAVLNTDDPHVIGMAAGFPGQVVGYGNSPDALLRAEDVRAAWPARLAFTLRVGGLSLPVQTRMCGRHWVSSALAGLAVADAMGIPFARAAQALSTFEPVPGRMSVAARDGITFIRDDAKAPLWGLDAMLEFLAEADARRKILVLGTISDHSAKSARLYPTLARRALAIADQVVFAGPNARHALRTTSPAEGALRAFATADDVAEHLRASLRPGDLVLLKGSGQTDGLDRIVPADPGLRAARSPLTSRPRRRTRRRRARLR